MSSNEHVPVLLGPVLDGLDIKKDGCYVDGTFGRGGHSREILKRLDSSGRLIGIDRDPDAIAQAPNFLTDDPRFELIRGESAQLETSTWASPRHNWMKPVEASVSSAMAHSICEWTRTRARQRVTGWRLWMNKD